jgi:glutamyl-tRNA reductase
MVVSTCNRTEIYACCAIDSDAEYVKNQLFNTLIKYKKLSLHDGFSPDFFIGLDVIEHLLRTCSGFSSLLLGETQVFGQFKKSYLVAMSLGYSKKYLNCLFQQVFRKAKEVRNKSKIQYKPLSLSSAVARVCAQIFSSDSNNVLFIGAGEMIRLVATHLKSHMKCEYVFCNRSENKAKLLATKLGGVADKFDNIEYLVSQADTIICATASVDIIVKKDLVEEVVSKYRKQQLYIDLAVPSNIDSNIQGLDGVFYYSIDLISKVIDDNLASKRTIVVDSVKLIDKFVFDIANSLPHYPKQKDLHRCYKKLQILDRKKIELVLNELKEDKFLSKTMNKAVCFIMHGLRDSDELEFNKIKKIILDT